MNAEIINVGNEILSGHTLNKNAQIISQILLSLGIKTNFSTVIADIDKYILDATRLALKRSDLIIFTGGLGPTRDDLTKEIVCEAIERKLLLDNEILETIESFFKTRNLNMTENNIKQAYVPEDSTILKNKNGTASGFFIKHSDSFIVLLPGPPGEMTPMFTEQVIPLLKSITHKNIISKTIKTRGIGESQLETEIDDIILNYQSVANIATYAKSGLVDISISISEVDNNEGQILLDEIYEKIKVELSDYIYSYNNETIEELVFNLLKENNLKIGFCESCTGGLVSSKITRLSGSSEVFEKAIVTYSNNAKVEEVDVKQSTLDKHGAVSSQTAIEMAVGLLANSNIDLAVSITGIAGPNGGSESKPVGLVYICLATKEGNIVEKNIFSGNRVSIQERASLTVFNLVRKHILTLMHK